ncbi:hypothetical protein [Streptomyces sp. NPDC057253]|uniref:hypothetical protein n=1 Tax=Streptomyces sp. NPDC057253 TaxID=3346069 RepID=UPI003634A72C
MALTIGELVGYIRADDSGMRRGLDDAELRMRGFQRDAEGRLRRLNGRFASAGEAAALGFGRADREGRRLSLSIGRIGSMAGTLGSVVAQAGLMALRVGAIVPAAAGAAAALANIAPAAAVGATAVLALAQATAAFKIGTSGIGSAIGAAFKGAGAAAGGAASGANGAAAAQQALKDAVKQAAEANAQAARRVKDAERSLSDAQKEARAAQLALNDARKQGARDLEDLNNQLATAELDQKDAINDVEDAQKALDEARKGDSTAEEIERAQLAYDRAVQRLKEQRTETDRLREDTEKANKAGVEGTDAVRDAHARIADTQREVGDRERDLADARREQAKTAADGIEQVRRAQEALNQAMAGGGGGGGGGIDPFAEAMAKLAPAAREFVYAVIALKPAWDALRLDVQQHLFQGLAQDLTTTARSVLPVLRTGLVGSADALNAMARGALASAKELATSGTLGRAMASANAGLHNLSGIPGIVVTAFGQLAAAAGPSFDRLTAAAGTAAADIGDRLGAAFESGRLEDAIETAVSLIGDLVDVGANVGSILGSIFSAAQVSGGGFINTLKEITGALAEAFASPPVQAGLQALFETMATLARTAAPLLGEALSVIGSVLAELGPPAEVLIQALGEALQPIIEALSPVLVQAADAVGALVVAASPLLPVIGQLVADLLPLLTPLLKGATDIFVGLTPVVQQVADLLGSGALEPVVTALSEALTELVTQAGTQFLNLVLLLLPEIPKLTPLLLELARSAAEILTSLTPLLPSLVMLSQTVATQLLPALIPLIPPLIQLTILFVRLATEVLTKAVIPALGLVIKFLAGMQQAFQPGIDAVKWLVDNTIRLFEWLSDVLVGHSIVPDMIKAIVAVFAGLPGRAATALINLGPRIVGAASNALSSMVSSIRSGLSTAVSWVRGLPGRARSALGSLGSFLRPSGRSLIQGFIDGIKSMIGSVRNAASNVVSAARDYFPFSPAKEGPFSGRGYTSYSGRALIQGFQDGIRDQLPSLEEQLRLLPSLPAMEVPAFASDAISAPNPMGAATVAEQSDRPLVLKVEDGGMGRFETVLTYMIRNHVKVAGGGSVQAAYGSS